jgi:hypothetical protein
MSTAPFPMLHLYTIFQPSPEHPLATPTLELLAIIRRDNPQHEINQDSQEQYQSEQRRAQLVIEAGLAPVADRLRPPVVREQRVAHGKHRDDGEEERRDGRDLVPEVQHADSERPEDDGEVQP